MNLRASKSFGHFQRCLRRYHRGAALAVLTVLAPIWAGASANAAPTLLPALGQMPLRFEAAEIEAGAPARFIARGPAYHLTITPTEALVTVRKLNSPTGRSPDPARRAETPTAMTYRNFSLQFVGANAAGRISGEAELPGTVNYFIGNDPARWRTGVPTFAHVRVADLYPGISLIHYGNQERLEYDFVVGPGADPAAIAIHIRGADQVTLDARGDLILRLGADEIRQPKPLIYQNGPGGRKEIAGGYWLADPETVKFEITSYDHRLPLVIDPILSYSTYYGGTGSDAAYGVAVDTNGFVYLAGESVGGLPTTAGTLTNQFGGYLFHGDAFVAKFDNRASEVIYLAYIGGALDDYALSLAVDNGGNAYITGATDSTDFPRQSAVFNRIGGDPYPGTTIYPLDGFVTKLGPQGTNLVYSTYLGGTDVDVGVGIAVDPVGSAYVAGYTTSTNFPTLPASFRSKLSAGIRDAFVTKFGPAGTNLVYSRYLGGESDDVANDIAVDALGQAYVTGYTTSTNFPTTSNAMQPWPAGGKDGFVTVVGTYGDNLIFSTYLGGAGDNVGYRLALDSAANIYVTGTTKEDSGFPISPGGVNPGGVFQSGDGGVNWNAASSGLQSVVVSALAVDPITPSRIYAATSRGVARTADGGATWSTDIAVAAANTGLAPVIAVGSVLCLAVDPVGPTNIYAGTAQGVFKSADAGTNWAINNIGLDLVARRTLAIDPSTPAILYVGGDSGVYKSMNGAVDWSVINNGLDNVFVRALAVDPVTPTTIYAATAGGVYRSINGGERWFGFNRGLTNLSTQTIAIDPLTPATVYVGTPGGVFKTIDAGTNWSSMNVGLTATNTTANVSALAIDPLTPATLYAGLSKGLFKSTDGGLNWNAMTNGLAQLPILAVQPNPQSPATLYVGLSGVSFFGNDDAFLTKLGADGYSVVLGGSQNDRGWDVAVDASGRAHLIGTTDSSNFPTRNTLGSLSATNAGGVDVFVAEVSRSGHDLNYAAYFGGSSIDEGYGIAVDAVGNVYLAGVTSSSDFPTRAALQNRYRGSGDAFLAKINNPDFQPVIDILAASNQVVLSWTALAPEFQLQSNTNLMVSNGWVNVAAAPVQTNQLLTVLLPATNAVQFFRLSNP